MGRSRVLRKSTCTRAKMAAASAVVVTATLLSFVAPAGAQSGALPVAGDPAVKRCVEVLVSTPVDETGAIEGGAPTSCTTALPQAKNDAAAASPFGDLAPDPGVTGTGQAGVCGSYVPPSVTITPTNPVPNGPYSASGINWPANSFVFGYSIAFNSIGLPIFIGGIGLVFTDSTGRFAYNAAVIDSRPAAYYELFFVSLACPSAQVQLRVNLGSGGGATTTTSAGATTTTLAGATTTTAAGSTTTANSPVTTAGVAATTTTGGAAVLAETVTATSPGSGVLSATDSRSRPGFSATTPSSAGLAFTGGSQNLLAWSAVLLGASGWVLLRLSRRRARANGSPV